MLKPLLDMLHLNKTLLDIELILTYPLFNSDDGDREDFLSDVSLYMKTRYKELDNFVDPRIVWRKEDSEYTFMDINT